MSLVKLTRANQAGDPVLVNLEMAAYVIREQYERYDSEKQKRVRDDSTRIFFPQHTPGEPVLFISVRESLDEVLQLQN